MYDTKYINYLKNCSIQNLKKKYENFKGHTKTEKWPRVQKIKRFTRAFHFHTPSWQILFIGILKRINDESETMEKRRVCNGLQETG